MTEPKLKILIVEDDLDVAEMLNAYFRVQGYEVFTVNWGEDGVRSCQTVHPDIVILDIRLPDIDGYEVARRLRGDRRTAGVPIIFLTEKRERGDRLLGLELGADDYITKPFDVQELRLRVRNSLRRVSQGPLTNPVTGLPEGAMVDEKLTELLVGDDAAILFISIENMDVFREAYGFVASDDVLRAISFMIVNTMREFGNPQDFLGHLDGSGFVLVLSSPNLAVMSEKLRSRLEQSMEYFYPIKDREQIKKHNHRLNSKIAEVASIKNKFISLDQIKAELIRLKK
ncbi:MAG: response regulator [Chloroflexi bacterium]|nr:response regulator [Chloroflexota bacterium]